MMDSIVYYNAATRVFNKKYVARKNGKSFYSCCALSIETGDDGFTYETPYHKAYDKFFKPKKYKHTWFRADSKSATLQRQLALLFMEQIAKGL